MTAIRAVIQFVKATDRFQSQVVPRERRARRGASGVGRRSKGEI